jgi:hypothetical protein
MQFKRRAFPGIVAAIFAALALPHIATAAPPANDDFDGAKVIASLPFSDTFNVTELSLANDDPAPCVLLGKTAWYKLTPGENQRVSFTTNAPTFIALDLFTGTRGNLQRVACTRMGYQPRLGFDLVAGTTYYLMVSPAFGWEVDLTVSAAAPPPGPANDDFDSATEIASHVFYDSVDTTDAIESLDDPVVCGQSYLANTVWYRWTAPGRRHVRIDTSGSVSPYQPSYGIYTGTRGALTESKSCLTSEFDAAAGKTYYLMFGTLTPQFGDGVLDVSFSAKGFSTVSLEASRSRLVYGQSVRLSGHVTALSDPAGDTVSIYRRTSWGSVSRFLAGTALVNEDGNFTLTLKPNRNFFYDAEWAGDDESLADASGTVAVRVAPRLTGRLYRFHHTSGGYKIYRPGTRPLYVVTIEPHLQAEIGVRLQVKRGGVWRRYANEAFAPNNDGVLGVVLHGLSVGVPYRIRAVFRSDGYHLDAHSSWAYLKIVS